MKLTPALLALALASSDGAITLADDGPQSPPASKATNGPAPSRSFFSRFRKPATPEVPPSRPRELPTAPAATPGPGPIPAGRKPGPAPGPLLTIPTTSKP